MATLRQPGSIQAVQKFYSGSWCKGAKAITEILQIPLTGPEVISLDWTNTPPSVVAALVSTLKGREENEMVKILRLLNKHWRTTISHQATSMKPAVLEKEDFPQFQKAMLQQFVNIQKLELPAAWMEDHYCARIALFKNCAELDFFWFDNVTDDGLRHIASLPNLSSLKIYHCRQISDKGLKVLSKSTVKELWLYGGVQVSDTGLECLSGCQSLKQLRLMYCNSITKRGLESFVNRPDMKLTVRFCRRIPCDIHIT